MIAVLTCVRAQMMGVTVLGVALFYAERGEYDPAQQRFVRVGADVCRGAA